MSHQLDLGAGGATLGAAGVRVGVFRTVLRTRSDSPVRAAQEPFYLVGFTMLFSLF